MLFGAAILFSAGGGFLPIVTGVACKGLKIRVLLPFAKF